MFFKLAANNVKRSLRDYAIYFLTLTFGVCLFYVFNSMDSQASMQQLSASQKYIVLTMVNVIGYVSVFISFILGFLVVYSNRFLMKRRKKELGIYMLLGMSRGSISRILVCETLLIGVFSLGLGLIAGIFASQGLSAVTTGMFEVDLSAYQFTFSLSALLKTLLYFGIMFAVVMIFNTVSISKCKLITLLQANRKNETFQIRSLAVSIVACVTGLACIGTAYYLVLVLAFQQPIHLGLYLLLAIILGCVGTLLFFFSLSGILLRVIKANKRLYYKGLNMFVFRQISSKINTTFLSCAVISLMLFMTMATFSVGTTVSFGSSQSLKTDAPFDLTITNSFSSVKHDETTGEPIESPKPTVPAPDATRSIVERFELQNILDRYAKSYFETRLYRSYDLTWGDLDRLFPNLDENRKGRSVSIMTLSDYNKACTAQGLEPIQLHADEFALNSTIVKSEQPIAIQEEQTITLGGKEYHLGIHKLLTVSYETNYSASDYGTMIVPDEAVTGLYPESIHQFLNVMYQNADRDAAQKISEEFERAVSQNRKQSSENGYKMFTSSSISREDVAQNSVGTKMILSFLAVYIGLVFLFTCVAVLALQQLAEASDNTTRYHLLRKLGTDNRMINRALFWQIAIYFAMPLTLAIIHTVVGVQFASTLLGSVGGRMSPMATSLITAGIMVAVYGGYFIATYLCCRSMIRQKKT